MPYISVRGVEHYYEWITELGSDRTHRPVMVFIHGWGGSARYWESTARELSNQFDCLLYDMRGFGRSKARSEDLKSNSTIQEKLRTSNKQPASATSVQAAVETLVEEEAQPIDPEMSAEELTHEMESYADDLAALLDALKLDKAYINAHSMGASVAVFFLNLYADRVYKAILTCSGVFEYDERSFTTFHKFGGYVVKFRPRWLYGLPFMDRFFMARFLHRSLPSSISRAFLDDFLMADYETARNTIFTSVSKKAAEVMPQEFARLTVPTLLVAGEHDIIIPAKLGQQAASLSDRVQYVEMAGTAHFPMLEDPPTYLRHVREFLAN
jgi:pimeloyl-ACP methyl ester carboxylesterase